MKSINFLICHVDKDAKESSNYQKQQSLSFLYQIVITYIKLFGLISWSI